jgi:hypothetical protein
MPVSCEVLRFLQRLYNTTKFLVVSEISGFHRYVDEIFALLGYYEA